MTLKKNIVLFAVLVVFVSTIFLFYELKNSNNDEVNSDENSCTNPPYLNMIHINTAKLCVEIVNSSDKYSKGLSKRENLNKNEGMLFEFYEKYLPSFWMKDMNFPIDIIWIDDNKIVDISKNLSVPDENTPASQLPLYSPSVPINYVLEVNAGFVEDNLIQINDNVILNNNNQ
jgi:uncharacterized membrane protein (UPF0127 family)